MPSERAGVSEAALPSCLDLTDLPARVEAVLGQA
jgi:hypothetical protein